MRLWSRRALAALATLPLLAALPAAAETAVLELYLARHGQTDWNLEKKIQGSTDNKLNATGQDQARALAVKLAGVQLDAVYTSGLVRAQETAAIAVPGVAARPLPALNERSFGKFEGMSEESSDPALLEEFKARAADPDDSLDGGESLASQAKRVAEAVAQIRAAHPSGRVLIVSHGGVTPLILAELLDLPPAEARASIAQATDEVYLVRLVGDAPPVVWKAIPLDKLDQL
jgi:broad specificity phosphatase PhoE